MAYIYGIEKKKTFIAELVSVAIYMGYNLQHTYIPFKILCLMGSDH